MLKLTGISFLAVAVATPVLAKTPVTQPTPGLAAPVTQNALGAGLPAPKASNDILTASGGMRASQIIGSSVYNDKNQKVGSVGDLVISPNRSLLVVIDVGGILGIGAKTVAVPFDKMEIAPASGNIGNRVILPGATENKLAAMPAYHYAAR